MIKIDYFSAISFYYVTKCFHTAKISVNFFLYFDSSNKQLLKKIEDPQGVYLCITVDVIVCPNWFHKSLYILVLPQYSNATLFL